MELGCLCGNHILQGIELGGSGNGANVNVVKFRLDNVTYLAMEDPEDGYRSHCKELIVSDEPLKYIIPDVKVVCSMKPNTIQEKKDILVITDKTTGGTVLEVGTGDYDDYYPYFHFEYHPENLVCNQ